MLGGGSSIPASRRFRMLLIGVGSIFITQLGILFSTFDTTHYSATPLWITAVLAASGIALMFAFISTLYRDLIDPSEQLQTWSDGVRSGALSIRLDEKVMGELDDVAHDINNLMDYLQDSSQTMEGEIRRQTAQFEQKAKSLQLLYDVAASLNTSRDLNDLLTRFLHTMRDIIHAKAGMVRLMQEDGEMLIVASFGISDEVIECEQLVPIRRCVCGSASAKGEVQFQLDLDQCHKVLGVPVVGAENLEMITVPLQYHGKNLGIYNLFVDINDLVASDDIKALFSSVGQHLGMAIEKAKLDDESKRLSIMQERNTLAHELHDSLAQTLASLRFQVSMLDESIEHQDIDQVHSEVQQIKGGLDEAYSELRELLAHFRAPMSSRSLLPAIEDLISNFRRQTGLHVLLQKEWESAQLPAAQELQIMRIIQESLTNIRKHSQAHTVRVLMRCDKHHRYHVLIEDDGVGMKQPAFSGHPGEHIGLSIMEERARHLGGKLRIESEPGEGTRVQLDFDPAKPARSANPSKPFALI